MGSRPGGGGARAAPLRCRQGGGGEQGCPRPAAAGAAPAEDGAFCSARSRERGDEARPCLPRQLCGAPPGFCWMAVSGWRAFRPPRWPSEPQSWAVFWEERAAQAEESSLLQQREIKFKAIPALFLLEIACWVESSLCSGWTTLLLVRKKENSVSVRKGLPARCPLSPSFVCGL